MADKRIDELEAAASVTTNDLFVLEQAGTAKKLDAQTLENWLLALAQGHGGITGIAKTGTAGTNPVVDTYTITFSDTSTTTFNVTNGIKGDTGAQTYVYIKYSNREPIADSDLTDTPSAWMGICATTAATAPTTYGSYSWYEIKGEKGDPGNDITIASTSVMYQAWTSGTQYPTGTWLANPPAVTPGNYLWTRTIVNYSDGGQTVSYSSARWGMDGSGAVGSVNSKLPDQDGNVTLTASDVGALPDSYHPPVTSVNNQTGTVVLDNEDVNAPFGFEVSATLSTAGWYRVCKTAYQSGSILKLYANTVGVADTHEVDLMASGASTKFINESSVCTHVYIDKIRCTYSGSDLFIDVHYNTANSNIVKIGVTAYGKASDNNVTIPSNLVGVNDAPSGETVLTPFDFNYNTEGVTDGWHYTLQGKHLRATKTITDTLTNYTTINGFFGYYISNITTPFTMASSNYYVGTTWSVGSGFSISAGILSQTTTKFNAYALATASGSQDVELAIVIEGEIA